VCNLYSITTNQAAIIALFRVINRYVGNLPPMPGVFPDYPAPVVRNTDHGTELIPMRWGMPPPLRSGGPPVTNIRNTSSPHWRGWLKRTVSAHAISPYASCRCLPPDLTQKFVHHRRHRSDVQLEIIKEEIAQ
jgi:putative SOS response-associated peptidase YedK